MTNRILIVEDDKVIAESIKKQVESWGISAMIVEDLEHVLDSFKAFKPHLVLLDIKLPFYDGYYWCNEIRKLSTVPIIFISSASDNMNIIMAMNMGGDDFIAKPFDLNVLSAKIHALLRRTYDFSLPSNLLEYQGAVLNTESQILSFNDEDISLTKNEYRILLTLLENKGKVVSREKLMERLWKSELFVDENTLTVNINRLRKKLNSYGLTDFIKTKVGQGYTIN